MGPWIRAAGDLAALAERLSRGRAMALDSESDSLHHHREKVCLVQIAGEDGEAVLVDPLALGDLSPLGPVLADPDIAKVLHGADYDVTTLKRDFGFAFSGLFDTMIAARMLGRPGIGLQAVARAELGVEISKDSQKDDWSVRPLSPRQEAYALADVRHLLALYGRLRAELEQKGRLEWVIEESAAVAALPAARREKDLEGWRSLKGIRRLSPRALSVLRELWAWREARAEASDRPAFKVLGSEALVEIAEKEPRTRAALDAVRGVPRWLRGEATLLAAVTAGLDQPRAEWPVLEKGPPRPILTEEHKRREAALRAFRTEAAAREALDVSVVLPQRLIDRLSADPPRDLAGLARVEGLRRWRAATFGPQILAILNAVR
jgi:ribonuclease D